MKKKNVFSVLEIIGIIAVTGIVSTLTTGIIIFSKANTVSSDPALNQFIRAYESVSSQFYEGVDEEKVIDSAIDGMMNYLGDRYSVYMDESQTGQLEDELDGEYKGLGIQIFTDNTIVEVYDNTPASKAGIKVGDVIKKINDLPVANSQESINEINKNEEVKMEVLRDNQTLTLNMKREIIEEPIVRSELIEEEKVKIGYLYISGFTKNVNSQFERELDKLEKEDIDSLIIDLRGNQGGYLEQANLIASQFIEKGKIIYSTENKEEKETIYDKTAESRKYKVVILQDETSASASEVLTAAMHDSYGATIIGAKSYGKGKIQQVTKLTEDSQIKYTTATWLTPKGICIDGKGITPDIEVKNEKNEENILIDKQLPAAIEYLTK